MSFLVVAEFGLNTVRLVAAFSFRICNSCKISYRRNIIWSFEPNELQLILRMASKDGVGDGTKTPSEIDKEDIEAWTSRQIKYLLRRRAAFKGVVTKNSKKAKDIISKNGSRTVLRSVKERVLQALQDASKATQDVIALQSDDVTSRAEAEEWLDSLRGEVDDVVDSIEEYLKSRADELPLVIGEFSFVADVVDVKESRNSESSDDSQVANSAQKFIIVQICTIQRE